MTQYTLVEPKSKCDICGKAGSHWRSPQTDETLCRVCKKKRRLQREEEARRTKQKTQASQSTKKTIYGPVNRITFLNMLSGKGHSGDGWKCACCGVFSDHNTFFDIHRITPGEKGGEYSIENCEILCPNCHRMKTHGISKANVSTFNKTKSRGRNAAAASPFKQLRLFDDKEAS